MLLDLNQICPEAVSDSGLFRRSLTDLQNSYSAPKVGQKIDLRPEVGEYSLHTRRYIARVASTEGEAKILSVWENRQGKMERVSKDLRDVSNWACSPAGRLKIIASTNKIYGEIAGVYFWEPRFEGWKVLKTFPNMDLCWLDKFSSSEILTCVVQRGKLKQTINLSL